MSSNINTIAANINSAFPVAGQDNSSQGFRDNFSFIKQAFSTATSEISDLQLKSVFVDQTNDFQYTGGIIRAKIQNSGYVANNLAPTTGDIDFAAGSYQKADFSLQASTTTVIVSNWPAAGIYAPLRLELKLAANKGVTFPTLGTTYKSIDQSVTFPYVGSVSQESTTLWDLWTSDGGTTVYVQHLGTV